MHAQVKFFAQSAIHSNTLIPSGVNHSLMFKFPRMFDVKPRMVHYECNISCSCMNSYLKAIEFFFVLQFCSALYCICIHLHSAHVLSRLQQKTVVSPYPLQAFILIEFNIMFNTNETGALLCLLLYFRLGGETVSGPVAMNFHGGSQFLQIFVVCILYVNK